MGEADRTGKITINLGSVDLEVLRDAGRTVHIRVPGLATLAEDVTPDLAPARSPRSRSSARSARVAWSRRRSDRGSPQGAHLEERSRT